MKHALLWLTACAAAAGCSADPCHGVGATCVALFVDRAPGVAQLDSLALHLTVGTTSYDKTAGNGRFALPADVAVVFDSFPDGVVGVDITAVATSSGALVLDDDLQPQLQRGQHASFHLTPSSSVSGADLGTGGGGDDLAGADLAGATGCNACPSSACFGGRCNKRIFVTSTLQSSSFGGLAGADAVCQQLADSEGMGGTYLAWLSDSTGSPATRFSQSSWPYVLVDGTLVADNWSGLVSGTLHHAISLTEKKAPPPAATAPLLCCTSGTFVWSNTTAQGTVYTAGASCGDWSPSGGTGSAFGMTDSTTAWAFGCSGGDCTSTAPLYCVEQ